MTTQPPPAQPAATPPAAPPRPVPWWTYDDATRNGDVYTVRLHTHTGLIVLGVSRTFISRGTFDQCLEAYRKAQRHNLLVGWLGVISLIVHNPLALVRNQTARGHLAELHRRPYSPPT